MEVSTRERRRHVRLILDAGIGACQPQRLINESSLSLSVGGRDLGPSLGVIAVGKAAWPMWQATWLELVRRGQPPPRRAVVVSHSEPPPETSLPHELEWFRCEHPVPGAQGLAAGVAVERAVQRSECSGWLVLISGGASALLPSPAAGLTLRQEQQVSEALLRSGRSIAELNIVRRHISRLKGGGLARLMAPAPVLVLVVSDVIGDDLAAIGSGPCAGDPTTFAEALDIARNVADVPREVISHLERGAAGMLPETLKPGSRELEFVEHRVLANHSTAARAAARTCGDLGYYTRVIEAPLQGLAHAEGRTLARRLFEERAAASSTRPVALVASGETVVRVTGDGKGGRCQELALAAGLELRLPEWTVLAAGTDGRDGPTDAGGAVLDEWRWRQLRERGVDVRDALRRNDSYPALAEVGALLPARATGTNVADLVVLLG